MVGKSLAWGRTAAMFRVRQFAAEIPGVESCGLGTAYEVLNRHLGTVLGVAQAAGRNSCVTEQIMVSLAVVNSVDLGSCLDHHK